MKSSASRFSLIELLIVQTGTNFYYTDASSVIHQNSTQTASLTDSPIGG